VVFAVGLTLWTWKLLEPSPVPESILGQLRSWDELLTFLLAKSLHCCGYAFLTIVGLIWVPTRWWPGIVGLLMLHSLASEVLQYVLPFNRFGRGADVAIDWIGIIFGILTYYFSLRAGRFGSSRM
jgi:hypothetical protein